MKTPHVVGVDAALQYLIKRNALGKLTPPCPVLYKDVICWKPKKLSLNSKVSDAPDSAAPNRKSNI